MLNKRTLPILFVNAIGTLGFSLVLPFLIFLVLDFGGNEWVYGLLGVTYSAFQFVGAPWLGGMSDRIGRRKVLLLSQAGTMLAWILFFIALIIPNTSLFEIEGEMTGAFVLGLPLLLLFLARAFDGLTGGNISVAQAYMADISTDEDRQANFGLMAASTNLGFMVGPALAGILGATVLGPKLPVLAAILISLIALVLIQWYLPESKNCPQSALEARDHKHRINGTENRDCYQSDAAKKLGIKDALKLPGIPLILGLYFGIFLTFNVFYVSFPVFTAQTLQWDTLQLGIFFSALSSLTILVQGPILRQAGKYASEKTLILIGSALLAVTFSLLSTGQEWSAWAGVFFFAFGNGLMWPSFLSVLSQTAGSDLQGAIQGLAGSIGSLASIIGLLAGGWVFRYLGSDTFLISAVLISLLFLIAIQLPGKEKNRIQGLPQTKTT